MASRTRRTTQKPQKTTRIPRSALDRLKRQIPARLSHLRGARSQRSFALELGVFQQNVNRYENGTTPHADFLITLALVLALPIASPAQDLEECSTPDLEVPGFDGDSLEMAPTADELEVEEAMVIGDRRKYVTALIAIEYDVVGNWALAKSIPYTTYRDLSEKPEVIELIQKVVNDTNERFARVEQIKNFRMMPKELDHEDGELTATQKLKRNAVEELFGDQIEDMYQ